MNFALRHAPDTTFDIDLWIEDTAENIRRCEDALARLDAEWGETDNNWVTAAIDPELLRREEEKRRRAVDPLKQWKAFQALCAWLDAQQSVPRNSKAGCLARQAKLLAAMEKN